MIMGVEIIQEFKKAGPNINNTDLPALIIGPCKQVVDEYKVLSTIPQDTEEFSDFSAPNSESDKVVPISLADHLSYIHTTVYYDVSGQYQKKPLYKEYKTDSGATISGSGPYTITFHNATVSEVEDKAIMLYAGQTASGGFTDWLIINPADIIALVQNGANVEITTNINLSSWASPTDAMIIDPVTSTRPFFIAMADGGHLFNEAYFVDDNTINATQPIKFVYQGFPLTFAYPNRKPGAEIETDSVGFVYKNATAKIMDDNFFPSVDTTTISSIANTAFGVSFLKVDASSFTNELLSNELYGYKIDVIDPATSEVLETHKIISNTAKLGTAPNEYYLIYIEGRWGRDLTGLDVKIEWRIDIGDDYISFYGKDLSSLKSGDVIHTPKGTYKIGSIDLNYYTINLATTAYVAETSTADGFDFYITRFYDYLKASADVTVKDWDAGTDNVTLYAAEDNENHPFIEGEIYLSYVAFRTDLSDVPFYIEDIDALKDMMDIDVRNPLGKALEIALANSDTPIYAAAIRSNNYDGFVSALENSEGSSKFYSIVCLTTDPAVLATLEANVESESAPENSNFKIGIVAMEMPTTKVVSEGSGNITT